MGQIWWIKKSTIWDRRYMTPTLGSLALLGHCDLAKLSRSCIFQHTLQLVVSMYTSWSFMVLDFIFAQIPYLPMQTLYFTCVGGGGDTGFSPPRVGNILFCYLQRKEQIFLLCQGKDYYLRRWGLVWRSSWDRSEHVGGREGIYIYSSSSDMNSGHYRCKRWAGTDGDRRRQRVCKLLCSVCGQLLAEQNYSSR